MKNLFLMLVMMLFASSIFGQSKLKRDIMEAKQILIVNGYSVTGISNDSIIAVADSLQLVTQYAMKKYIDANAGGFLPDGETITVDGSVDTTLISTRFDLQKYGVLLDFFGAVGDGITNDSTAIENALNFANSNNYFIRLTGGKTYATTGGHHLFVSMFGDGKTTLKLADNSNKHMFVLRGSSIIIDGVVIDGNKSNQSELVYAENYEGFRSQSILQCFEGIENLTIKNCHFYDTKHGALVIQSKLDNGVNSIVDTSLFSNTVDTIKRVIVSDNVFERIGTQCIVIFNHRYFDRGLNNKINYFGEVVIRDNKHFDNGTIQGVNAYGDCYLTSAVRNFKVIGNDSYNEGRMLIKCASINNIQINNNYIQNPYWGGFQIVSSELDSFNWKLGQIEIKDNKYIVTEVREGQTLSHFAQIRGSSGDILGLEKEEYESVVVQDNYISFDSTYFGLGITTDAIQFVTNSKFETIKVKGNYFNNVPRAAILYANGVFDNNYKIKNLIIEGNVNYNLDVTNTPQSLLYAATSTGHHLDNLIIENNTSLNSSYPLYLDGTVSDNLIIKNNNLGGVNTEAVYHTGTVPSFLKVEIEGNYFNGSIDLGGDLETISNISKWGIGNKFETTTQRNNTLTSLSPNGTEIHFPIGVQTAPAPTQTFRVIGNNVQNYTGYFYNAAYVGSTAYALAGQMSSSQVSNTAVGLSGFSNNVNPIRNIGITGYAVGTTNNVDLYLGALNFNNVGNYGIYQVDKTQNYFSGKIGIGITTPTESLHIGTGKLRMNGYGTGNNTGGSYSYVLAPDASTGLIGEFPLSGLQNHTYVNTNNGVDLLLSASTLAAALKIDQLPIEPTPSGTLSYMAIETSASGVARKIQLNHVLNTDADFSARMNTYNASLNIVEATTSQAAQTASTAAIGEEFYWRKTGETGLIKMRKE